MKKLITSASVSLVAVFAYTGAQASINTDSLNAVNANMTEAQVLATLGKPEAVTHWSDGTHSLTYELKDNAQAQAYIDISDASSKLITSTIIRRD